MTILKAELKFYKPRLVTDDATNGGRISVNEIINNTAQNTFGHAFSAERGTGSTKYRKIFMRVDNDADETLFASLFRFFMPTEGDDYCCFFAGDEDDTQNDIIGTERKYGVGTLNTAVSAGGSTIIMDVQNAAHAAGNDIIIANGDKIFITDKDTYDASTGNVEQHTVSSFSVSGTEITIVLTGTLANGYAVWNSTTRTGGKIMTCKDFGEIKTVPGTVVVTSSAGTYNGGSCPPVLDNLGTLSMTVTHTFTDATNFTATCDDPDVTLGSGVIGTDYAPQNPDFSRPYYTFEAAGHGGTFAAGDTIVFPVTGAYVSVWEKRVIPASCGSLTGNKLTLVVGGESA